MSRSIQRSKCTRAHCLVCKPHKVTGERPIAERRALDATADLVANDMYVPPVNEYDGCGVCPWDGPCPHCDLPPVIEDAVPARTPLRAPLAEIARAA